MSCYDQIHDWIGLKQPGARFLDASWSRGPCSGRILEVGPGNYPHSGDHGFGNDNADGVWLPANMSASFWEDANYRDSRVNYGPGLHEFPGWFKNEMTSAQIRIDSPWDEHIKKCCRQDIAGGATPETCGSLWGDPTICDSVIRTHCSKDTRLMSEEDKKLCSCFIAEVPDDIDPEVARLIRANPNCFSKDCNIFGYKPESLKNTGPCPSIKICKQDFAVMDGSNNLVTDNVILQDCSGKGTQTESKDFEFPDWFNLKNILIFLIVLFVILILFWSDTDVFSGSENRFNSL